jgi:hypothetical protein
MKRRYVIVTLVLLVLTGFALSVAFFGPPFTLDQAVERVYSRWLDSEDRDRILRMPKDTAGVELHMSLGMAIRNEFGLWSYNEPLRRSCGSNHPDDCSAIIIDQLWHRIRQSADQSFVQRLDEQFSLADQIKIDYSSFNLVKIGSLLSKIQNQIDVQTRYDISTLSRPLELKIIGEVNLDGYTRAEIAEPGVEPMSLERLFGWIGWRNGFSVRHNPPYVELRFHEPYAWPEPPDWFKNLK